jgi:hypothetical protein
MTPSLSGRFHSSGTVPSSLLTIIGWRKYLAGYVVDASLARHSHSKGDWP